MKSRATKDKKWLRGHPGVPPRGARWRDGLGLERDWFSGEIEYDEAEREFERMMEHFDPPRSESF